MFCPRIVRQAMSTAAPRADGTDMLYGREIPDRSAALYRTEWGKRKKNRFTPS
jgi:hypothetical protein